MAGETGAAISITIFVLVTTIALYITPLIVKQFAKWWLADLAIKRGLWVIATYLMTLNSAIMMTLAGHASLPLTREMFIFMWLFGWAGYILMVWLVIKTLFDALSMWKIKKYNERMGEDE